MVQCTKDGGKIINPVDKDVLFTIMVTFSLESGLMENVMDKVITTTWMELSTQVIGKMINNTVWVLRPGLIIPSMMVSTKKERNMDKVNSYGLMAAVITVRCLRMTFMVLESTTGQMADNMKETGLTEKCKDKENILGLMEDHILETIMMISNKEKAHFHGQMAGITLVAGHLERKMDKEPLLMQMERQSTAFGSLVRD